MIDLIGSKREHLAYLSQCQGLQLAEAIGMAIGGTDKASRIVEEWGDRIKSLGSPEPTLKVDDTDELLSMLGEIKSRMDAI